MVSGKLGYVPPKVEKNGFSSSMNSTLDQMKKKYYAIVEGKFEKKEGCLIDYLKKDEKKNKLGLTWKILRCWLVFIVPKEITRATSGNILSKIFAVRI